MTPGPPYENICNVPVFFFEKETNNNNNIKFIERSHKRRYLVLQYIVILHIYIYIYIYRTIVILRLKDNDLRTLTKPSETRYKS